MIVASEIRTRYNTDTGREFACPLIDGITKMTNQEQNGLPVGMMIAFHTEVPGVEGIEIVSQTTDPEYVVARVLRSDKTRDALPPDTKTDNVVSLDRFRDSGEEIPPTVLTEAEADDHSEIEQRVKELIAEVNQEPPGTTWGTTITSWIKFMGIILGGFSTLVLVMMIARGLYGFFTSGS